MSFDTNTSDVMLSKTECDTMVEGEACSTKKSCVTSNHADIKISNSKIDIIKFCSLIKELNTLKKAAQNKILSSNEWNNRLSDCEYFKSQISHILKQFQNDSGNNFKEKLKKRHNLRKSTKRNKKKRMLLRKMLLANRHQLITHIDKIIKDKKNDLAWEKEKHTLRKDADIVLADVRAKRTDVTKFLTMLREMRNLRKTKVDVLKQTGTTVYAEANQFFESIIDTLMQQWSVLDIKYSVEEKGIKLIIEDNNWHKILSYSKKIFRDWESTLFNQKIYSHSWSDCNLQIYLNNRSMWDQYLEEIEGTKVPFSWIIPCRPSSAQWAKYQANTC